MGKNNSGSPYVWRSDDFNELINSESLFARKFDTKIDDKIINLISNYVNLNKETNRY